MPYEGCINSHVLLLRVMPEDIHKVAIVFEPSRRKCNEYIVVLEQLADILTGCY